MPIKNIKAFSLSQNTGESTDPVRNTIQSFWSYDGSELVYDTRNLYNPTEKEANTKLLLFKFGRPSKSRESIIELNDDDITLDIKTTKEKLDITPEYLNELALESPAGFTPTGRTKVNPEDNFDSYIEDQIIPSLGTPLTEYKINLDSPIEYVSSVDNKSAIAGTVNFVYNYGLQDYEDTIKPAGVVEANLANFYKIFSIDTEKITKRRVMRKLNQSARQRDPIQDFFMNSDGFIEALDKQSVKDSFPFYNEVYFTNPPDNIEDDKFQEALKASGLLMAVCNLMNREDFQISQQENSVIIDSTPFINSYLSSSYQDDTQTSFKVSPALKGMPINLYDVPEMLKVMYEVLPPKSSLDMLSITPVESLRDKGFLTDGEQADYRLDIISQLVGRTTLTNNYENALDDLVDTINELISNDDNFKSYTDILANNKKTYQSNVLFYRIKKFEDGSDTPIQNFWIPAEKGYRGVRYIDTQVKYGKMYRYEVYAFKFVIGTEYKFTEVDAGTFNFDDLLSSYVEEIQEPLTNMIGLGIIRETFQQMYAEYPDVLPGFSSDFKGKIVDQQTTVALAEAVDQNNFFSREMVKVNSGSAIDIVAQNVLSGGTLPETEVNLSMLTEEEKQALKDIRSSWECLSNTNGTGFGTLAEIEISVRNTRVLGQIQEIIIQELTDEKKRNKKVKAWVIGLIITAVVVTLSILTFGSAITGGLATISSLSGAPTSAGIVGSLFGTVVAQKVAAATAAIAGALAKIIGPAAAGVAASAIAASSESKKSNQTGLTVDDLELRDIKRVYTKINALTALPLPFPNSPSENQLLTSGDIYFIDFPADPQTFDLENVDVPRLNTGLIKFDEDESGREYRQTKREELKQIETLLSEETQKLESLIATFNGCYLDFVIAANSFSIVADYKRINKYSLISAATPTIKFAELPYFRSEGMILDNPPIYPNVNVITYRDVADKLSLFMNSGQGEIEIVPVSFSDAEDTFITNYRKSRKLNDFQPLLYKSDETENLGTVFEIRRLSSPPESYDSFRTARTVTTINSIKADTLPAATYDDIVRSNTKYYYIFRVADRRGTISYPSGVIEIEIIENSGIIYPIIKPYEFKKQKTDTTKNLKRLLNIVPRITQVVPPVDTLSYESLTPGPTSILGREEENLFGKQFKLRLTSKQTGKAVDLNLNFKATVIEAAEAE